MASQHGVCGWTLEGGRGTGARTGHGLGSLFAPPADAGVCSCADAVGAISNKKFYLTKHVGGKPLIVLKAYGLIPDCTKDGKVGIIGFHFLTCGDRSQPFLCGT